MFSCIDFAVMQKGVVYNTIFWTRKKLRLNLEMLQLKWFFNCIFGFNTLENPWDALIVQKLAIKLAIPINRCWILTGKTNRKDIQKVAL